MNVKKLMRLLFTLCMILSVVSTMSIAASADTVSPPTSDADFLKFESDATFTITIGKSTAHMYEGKLWYSTDKTDWNEVTGGSGITAKQNDNKYVLYFAGKGNTVITGTDTGYNIDDYRWQVSRSDGETLSDISASGNIMTLLDYANPDEVEMGDYAFQYMFGSWSKLVTAPGLPATKMANYCYHSMFSGCTALKSAPALPAEKLATSCYSYMFLECSGLETAPQLPATTLADSCYRDMFYNCTSLTSAPELGATTLVKECYGSMFAGCTNLTILPDLPATTLAVSCYESMFSRCTNLTTLPDLPATTLAVNCYKSMFYKCTNLTTLPDLPATTLADGCYESMFSRCTGIMLTETDQGNGSWNGIPSGASGSSNYATDIFSNTSGEYRIAPDIGKTYYYMAPKYVEFSSDASFTITPKGDWEGDLWYSTDGNTWTLATKNTAISSSSAKPYQLRFRGKNNTSITGGNTPWTLAPTEGHKISVNGNIMSLMNYENPNGKIILTSKEFELDYDLSDQYDGEYDAYVADQKEIQMDSYAFAYMFANQTSLITLPYLSAIKLSDHCYKSMFEGCSSIKLGTTDKSIGSWIGIPSGASGGNNQFDDIFKDTGGTFTGMPALGTTYYYEPPDAVASAAYYASLTLKDNIDINFKIENLGTDKKGTDFDKTKLAFTVNGTDLTDNTTFTFENGIVSGMSFSVYPDKMSTTLHVVVTYDGVTIKTFDYSISNYCNTVFNSSEYGTDSALYKLCEALLNYGKWTEDYANEQEYGVDNYTASKLNDGHEVTFGTNYTFTGLKNKVTTLGDYVGSDSTASLALGSTIKLKFVLKDCTKMDLENDDPDTQNVYVYNDAEAPVEIDPQRVIITKDGNDTIISIDLYASQLSSSYTLKLDGVDTKDFCITYGVYNYCYDINEKQTDETFTDTLKTLCKAIHNYSEEVQDYMESLQPQS